MHMYMYALMYPFYPANPLFLVFRLLSRALPPVVVLVHQDVVRLLGPALAPLALLLLVVVTKTRPLKISAEKSTTAGGVSGMRFAVCVRS